MLKQILSYIFPINIYKKLSKINKSIEITWNNGELVLDSCNTNYSYGSLQKILKKGLKTIGFEKIESMDHILVLGVAGGSIIKTINNETQFKGKITGVELDSEIIEIANKYFQLDKIQNLEIIISDANDFVKNSKDKYDLIIIDIFQDTTMPEFLFETQFNQSISQLLNKNGVILFNTMLLNKNQNNRNLNYISDMEKLNFDVQIIPRVEFHNELIISYKKQ